jgi:TatD DNase family protein
MSESQPTFIDSHVNLHSDAFADERDDILVRARQAGVAGMLLICDVLANAATVHALSEPAESRWSTVGVHPHYAKDHADLSAGSLVELGQRLNAVAIGECGLDRYYEHSPGDVQEAVFRQHIRAARDLNLPLVVHTRDAEEEMMAILGEEMQGTQPTVLLHCYTGSRTLLEFVLERGGYAAYSGIITFKNAQAVRDVAAATPLERTLIETDCPYLAPVPFRGRRNEPSFLPHVAEGLARVHESDLDHIARHTTKAFFDCFPACKVGQTA